MQLQKDDIRSNILITAGYLFIRRSYEDTSLKMIADRCNISKSNIYRYYSSKEEIYETLVRSAREEIMRSTSVFFEREFIDMSVIEKCEKVSSVLGRLFSSYRSEIRIMLRSEKAKDKKQIESFITDSFVSCCPISERRHKELVSKMLMFGLTDILETHSDEESLSKELRALIAYHYLGLNGLKEVEGVRIQKLHN